MVSASRSLKYTISGRMVMAWRWVALLRRMGHWLDSVPCCSSRADGREFSAKCFWVEWGGSGGKKSGN